MSTKVSTDELLVILANAKAAKAAARKEWVRIAAEVGPCDGKDLEEGSCYSQEWLRIDEWCDSCRARQAPWKAYRKASSAAGGALRGVLRRARYLAGLDALRDKDIPHLTLGLKLEIANKARRAVAAKLGAVPRAGHLPTEFKA